MPEFSQQPSIEDHENAAIQLVRQLVKALADAPGAVRVESHKGSSGVDLVLHVAAEDLGKIIGRQGRTARSLRTVLAAASKKWGQSFHLKIVENTSVH